MSAPDASSSENQENIPQDIRDALGDFDVASKLGQGAYGTVYLGINRSTGQRYAIKRCLIELDNTSIPIAALRETNTIAKVIRYPHINLVQAHNIYLNNSSPQPGYAISIVMEYCDTDLLKYLSNINHYLSWDHVFSLSHQLISGMKHLHELSIIHRDLKPANILLQMNGTLKITDFGLCRAIGSENTLTNVVVTLWYRPPELLLEGGMGYNSSVDVWSLGVILLELCNGVSPFRARSEIELLKEQFNVLGFPAQEDWIPGCQVRREAFYTGPNMPTAPVLESYHGWSRLFPRRERKDFPDYFLRMIMACLSFNMDRRPSMRQLLLFLEDHAQHPLCSYCNPQINKLKGMDLPPPPPPPSSLNVLNANDSILPHQIPLLERYCRSNQLYSFERLTYQNPYPPEASTGAKMALACEYFQHKFRNGIVLDIHPQSRPLNENLKLYLQRKTLQFLCRLRAIESQSQQPRGKSPPPKVGISLPSSSNQSTTAINLTPGHNSNSERASKTMNSNVVKPSNVVNNVVGENVPPLQDNSEPSRHQNNPFSTLRSPVSQIVHSQQKSESPSVVLGPLASIRVDSSERIVSKPSTERNSNAKLVRRAQSCAVPPNATRQIDSSSSTVVHRSGAIHRRRSNYLQQLKQSHQNRLFNSVASPSNRAGGSSRNRVSLTSSDAGETEADIYENTKPGSQHNSMYIHNTQKHLQQGSSTSIKQSVDGYLQANQGPLAGIYEEDVLSDSDSEYLSIPSAERVALSVVNHVIGYSESSESSGSEHHEIEYGDPDEGSEEEEETEEKDDILLYHVYGKDVISSDEEAEDSFTNNESPTLSSSDWPTASLCDAVATNALPRDSSFMREKEEITQHATRARTILSSKRRCQADSETGSEEEDDEEESTSYSIKKTPTSASKRLSLSVGEKCDYVGDSSSLSGEFHRWKESSLLDEEDARG